VKPFSLAARCIVALSLVVGFAHSARAQTDEITAADVQQLQRHIDDAARAISAMHDRDGALAADLQSELNDARDDATYLKVKARRNEPIAPREYTELRDRIDNIASRARGDIAGGSSNPAAPRSTDRVDQGADREAATLGRGADIPGEVPVGTEFDVRLQTHLSSATSQPEDRFEATTMVDLVQDGRVLVPAGSTMRGVVRSVAKATRLERKGSLSVAFDRITIDGRAFPIRATLTEALEGQGLMGEKEKIGAGAGVGAIIGGILGGVKGALAGILVGGGGVIAATEGDDVDLRPGTVLRVRLDEPLDVGR
jgi:hypothetical protein